MLKRTSTVQKLPELPTLVLLIRLILISYVNIAEDVTKIVLAPLVAVQ